jgi:hypothetical protein
VFKEFRNKMETDLGHRPKFLVQVGDLTGGGGVCKGVGVLRVQGIGVGCVVWEEQGTSQCLPQSVC